MDYTKSMRKYLPFSGRQEQTIKQKTPDEDSEINMKQLKIQIDRHLQELTKKFMTSEDIFRKNYSVSQDDNTLKKTLQQLISTIEGLMSIIEQLRAEYDEVKEQLVEHQTLKNMLGNHQKIIGDLQESHSQQVAHMYEQRRKRQEQYQAQFGRLRADNVHLCKQLQETKKIVSELQVKNADLKTQIQGIVSSNKHLARKQQQIQLKYKFLTQDLDATEKKKVVNLDNLKLEYIFYYGKLKKNIISYLSIQDIVPLFKSNRFYYKTLKKQLPQQLYLYFKRKQEKQESIWTQNAKLYQKIFQLFPNQNIKTNAFKYLHFKIKPATYILPFLQEEQIELNKKEPQEQKQKQGGKLNWKNWFNSEKNSKNHDKKEENKFNLATLKNEDEFKKVQGKIQSTFKNILHLSMPQDLQYFRENMERQLQELKQDLIQYRQGKSGQLQWTAQLYCLTRYMYHEVGQLYNLLQVIFGELLKKNKQLIVISQDYEYLKENQGVLRNLIENLSNDKSVIEKKYLLIQNQILKKNLQKEAAVNNLQSMGKQYQKLKKKYEKLEIDQIQFKQVMDKVKQQRRNTEQKIAMIKQELEGLDKLTGKAQSHPIDIFQQQITQAPEQYKN